MVAPRPGAQTSLYSPQWYRLASLKPALGRQVRLSAQHVRGTRWMLLSRPEQRGQMRLNQAAWAIVARCDGQRTLNEIWQWVATHQPDELPAQHALMPILASLVRHGYLNCESWPDLDERQQQWDEDTATTRRQQHNLLAPRWRLGDPSGLIEGLYGLCHRLVSPWILAMAAAVLALALVCAAQQFEALSQALTETASRPTFWLQLWCVYPFIKIIHELAHGLTLRHFGGSTRELGVALLMLMPAPYVDASEASLLGSGRQRAAVSAAGIVTELMLASLALIAWTLLADGLLRDLMLAIALIGSVMTVFLNGNPLIRFDGYYVLTDLTGLANLSERSSQRWHQGWLRLLTGVSLPMPECDATERAWQLAYAPLAWSYRVVILGTFAFWIGGHFRAAGLALLAMAAMMLLVMPLVRLLRSALQQNGSPAGNAALGLRAGLLAGVMLGAALLPLPDRTLAQAIVWLPDDARIRARQPGYIVKVHADAQASRDADQTLVQMHDPLLDARIDVQAGIVNAARSEWISSMAARTGSRRSNPESLRQAERTLSQLRARREQLTVRLSEPDAVSRFRLIAPASDLPGRFVEAGELLGVAQLPGTVQLRAVLNESQAARLLPHWQRGQSSTLARLSTANGATTTPARISGFTPAALSTLPAPAFAASAGGSIEVTPGTDDQLHPAAPAFQLDLTLPAQASNDLVPGQRVWIRLDFGYTSALLQIVRSLGHTFNTRMAPGWS